MSKKHSILLVDDEASMRTILHDKFVRDGYDILQAENGEQGFSVAKESKPDIIISDITMPKMNGMEMMEKLRESSDWGKNVPIILFTNLKASNSSTLHGLTCIKPCYYLIKGETPLSVLQEKVEEILNSK